MTHAHAVAKLSPADVLGKSTLNAGRHLGLSADQVGEIIGRGRTSITRNGIDPTSKVGDLAMLLVRLYRSVHTLMGGDAANIRHFMTSYNRGTQGRPIDQVFRVDGLVRVVSYLDAMRGRA
ncbi:MbcA/ParS/Xre antitoxin family protein [Neiella marina]|uniref:MbcA/ParS/Xre antitoxin family protein n=2 Tax=Neiella holothuriorum TaxID=2870530 RepID=A0ABS7ED63_9GAMM|nr:MbcA/ParS/Xre antitoxin family protein [Neiella holothuriorum]